MNDDEELTTREQVVYDALINADAKTYNGVPQDLRDVARAAVTKLDATTPGDDRGRELATARAMLGEFIDEVTRLGVPDIARAWLVGHDCSISLAVLRALAAPAETEAGDLRRRRLGGLDAPEPDGTEDQWPDTFAGLVEAAHGLICMVDGSAQGWEQGDDWVEAADRWCARYDRVAAAPPAHEGEAKHEVDCPSCGATIRARMADADRAGDTDEWPRTTYVDELTVRAYPSGRVKVRGIPGDMPVEITPPVVDAIVRVAHRCSSAPDGLADAVSSLASTISSGSAAPFLVERYPGLAHAIDRVTRFADPPVDVYAVKER